MASSSLCFAASPTTTTLTVTPASPITAGTLVSLSASVTDTAGKVSGGTVLFYDSFAPNLPIAAIQLTTAGSASIKKVFGVGSHTLTAKFMPTRADLASTSAAQTLVVTGTQSYADTLTLQQDTSNGDSINLRATFIGAAPPTGTVVVNSSVTNQTLGSATLATSGFAFQNQTTYPDSGSGVSVVTGDFNNDGFADVAIVETSGKVVILLGNGDGTLKPGVEYAVGNGPAWIVAGDFNKDGKLDLAVTNAADQTISILIGVGDGTFLTQTTYPTGPSPLGITTADIDGDGTLDLIVVDSGSADSLGNSNVEIFPGKGDGTFAVPSIKLTVQYAAQHVAVGDLNADGLADIVVSHRASVVSVLLQKPDGTFQPPVLYSTDYGLKSIQLADMNNDGKLDIVVSAPVSQGGSTDVLLGNGDGTFKTYRGNTDQGASTNFVIGDFNRDGILDYATGTNVAQGLLGVSTLTVFFGKGDGTFGNSQTVSAQAGAFPSAFAVADFNGDGLTDIVGSFQGNGAAVNLGYQKATGILPNITVIQEDQVTGTYTPPTGDAYAPTTSPNVFLEPASYFFSLQFDSPPISPIVAGTIPNTLQVDVLENNVRSTTAVFPVTLTVRGPNDYIAIYNQTTAQGAATFTLPAFIRAGTYTLTATSTSAANGNATATIVVTPGVQTATALFLSNPYPSHASLGVAAPVTIAVLDQNGNPDLAFTGTVALTTGDRAALLTPASHTFVPADMGVFTFMVAFNTQGTQTLTFTSAGLNPLIQGGIKVLPASTITLTYSPVSPVPSLSAFTLQAEVTVGGQPAVHGTVNFYDSSHSPQLIATAQVNSRGQATNVKILGAGTHPITAVFQGNATAGASTSPVATLVVTPMQNYVTANLLNGQQYPGYDRLVSGLSIFGTPAPTGKVNFVDGSNNNAIVDTVTPRAGGYSFTVDTGDTPVGIAPYALVTGDFNGDGTPDVIVVNSNAADNTIEVLLGIGNFQDRFQAPLIYAVGKQPAGVAVGDFNSDGKLDLAVANSGDNTVSILLGNGDGSFQVPVSYAVGSTPIGVAVGDFDFDGNLDLVVANSGSNTVSILRGNGDGTFNPQTTVAVGTSPQNIAVADLNGDGSLDLAVTNQGSNNLSVLLGHGDGTFAAQVPYPTGNAPYAIVAADIASNGKVSLVTTNTTDGTLSFLSGNGDGTFGAQTALTVGSQPRGLAVADFNNDGLLDVAVSSSGDLTNSVKVYYGYQGGTLEQGYDTTLASAGRNPQGIAALDLNGTGISQIVVAGNSEDNQYNGYVSRPAVSLLANVQVYAAYSDNISFQDSARHVVYAEYVPGPNDPYEDSRSINGITVIGALAEDSTILTQPAGPLTAGIAFPNVVVAAEKAGSVDTTYSGPLSLIASGVTVPYSKTYTMNATNGRASFPVTPFTRAGIYRFSSFIPNVSKPIFIVNSDISVVAAPAARLAITTNYISPAARGVAGVVGVTVEDTFGNPVSSYTGTVNITSSDAAAVLNPPSHTYLTTENGYYPFAVTFNTTGTQSVTASVSGLTSATEGGIVVAAPQSTTTTTLTFSPSSPQPAGSSITLTARVVDATNAPVTVGVVNFYDSAATPTLIASAPLTLSGTATFRTVFAVGTHNISATFQPKNTNQASTSGTQPLVISPAQNYVTQLALGSTGTPSAYTVTGTLAAFGAARPTGTVNFVDTSNTNAPIGAGTFATPTSAFAPQVPYTVGLHPGDAIRADLNGDGKLDLAVINTADGTLSILLGNGDGTFGTASVVDLNNEAPLHLASGDFNGDGNLDLVTINNDGTLSLLLGHGDGTFAAPTNIGGIVLAEESYYGSNALAGIALGDFNRDGKLDLAISNVIDGTIIVLLGYGDGTFQQPVSYAGETGPQGLAVGDLNGDGYPDLVVANSNGNTVSVLFGKGDGTFGQQATYPVGEVPTQVAIADFNNDGKPDVAVTNQQSGTVSILLNKGDGTLLPQVASPTGNGPANLVTGDFNNDARQDVVVVNTFDSTAVLLLGKGDGTLGTAAPFTTGLGPDGLAAGDFAGDGRLSLAVANGAASTLSVLAGEQLIPSTLPNVSFPGTGLHKVQAIYNVGTADPYAGSTSPTINLYGKATPVPVVGVSSPRNPAAAGASVTLTAALSSTTAGTITGTVTFYDGATLLGTAPVAAGTAAYTTSTLALGGHLITAAYSGDNAYASVTSPAYLQIIGALASSQTSLASSASPAVVGVKVTLTVIVSSTTSGTPTGTVTFYSDGMSIGTATLSAASASISITTLPIGTHSITATYPGDANFQTSSAFPLLQVITRVPTSTAVTASPTQILNMGPSTLTATVTSASGTPTGMVAFSDGSKMVGNATLNSSGIATYPDYVYPVGAHNITATYLGDTTYAGSTSTTVVINVVLAPNTTSIAFTVTPNPSTAAAGVTLSATIKGSNGGIPTGSIAFTEGSGNQTFSYGSGPVDATGNVTIQTSQGTPIATGTHYLSALYSGDTNYQAVTSNRVRVDIEPDARTPAVILTSSARTALSGTPLTFTTTIKQVSGPVPTGTVTLVAQGNTNYTFGPIPLNSAGVAIFTTSSLPAYTFGYFVTATYNGDSNYTGGGTDFVFQDITQGPKLPTNITLAANPNPVPVGANVTLSSTVSPASPNAQLPTGSITFYDGSRILGTQPISTSASATFTISSLPAGTHSITSAYNGDSFYDSSVTSPLILTVGNGKTATTTLLSSSPDPSTTGQPVAFIATITPGSGSATPTGSVTFSDGAATIGTGPLAANGTATFTTASLAAGNHSITATYAGDSNFAGSASAALTQTVNQTVSTSTTSLSATPNPATVGQTVTLSAAVASPASGSITGTVSFYDGPTRIGTATLATAGTTTTASLTITTLTAGPHSLTAVYSGSPTFGTSTSSAVAETITAVAASSSTTLNASPNPAAVGQTVTLTASVTASATGTVSFYDGLTKLGTASVNNSTAALTVATLTAGTHALTAIYSGDTNFTTSTSAPVSEIVNAVISATASTLTASPNPAAAGQTVTLTASVATSASGTPTGSVGFFDGSTKLGTATLTNSSAALTISTLAPGAHTLTAVYSGDPTFTASTSPALTEVINLAATSTTLVASPISLAVGQSVTFTAAVTSPTSGTITGTVSFFDGHTLLGTGTLSAGSAAFSTSTLAAGSHSITAAYAASASFAASTSSPVVVTVNAAATSTSTSVSTSPNPSLVGQAVTLTATLTATGTTKPTGTINFYDGATLLGTGTLTNGTSASYSTAALTAGPHTITAAYPGDPGNAGSTSSPIVQVVNKATATAVLTASPNPSTFGATVTLTATLTSTGTTPPTGLVTFLNGATTLGTATLTSGTATFTITNLPAGSSNLSATFPGDPANSPATSPVVTEIVSQAATSVTLTSSRNPSGSAQPVTFTATLSPAAGPTGTVNFYDGTSLLGTSPLTSGTATFLAPSLTPGTHSITATYVGDPNFKAATSPALAQVVTAVVADFALTGTSLPQPILPGNSATFTITAAAMNGSYNTPVVFTVSGLPTGFTASFSPATITPGSTAASTTLTVNVPVVLGALSHGQHLWFAGILLLLPLLGRQTRRQTRSQARSQTRRTLPSLTLLLLAGLLTTLALGGCGGGFYAFPPRTYTLTITGTSGSTQHTTTVNLPVD